MPYDLEKRMWRQLKGAFDVDGFDLTDNDAHFEQVLNDTKRSTKKIFLEPTGKKSIIQIPTGKDLLIILGNTDLNNLKYSKPAERYRIDTPNQTHLYGTNAAAIVLAYLSGLTM